MMKCQLCGSPDAFRVAMLPHEFYEARGWDRRTVARAWLFISRVLRKRGPDDTLKLCEGCVERVDITNQFRLNVNPGSDDEILLARIMVAAGAGASEEELSRMIDKYSAGIPFNWPGDGCAETAATGCKSERGCEVIYLPNARPRARARPGRGEGAA